MTRIEELKELCFREASTQIQTPEVAKEVAISQLIGDRTETLLAILVDARNSILHIEKMEGSVNKIIIYPREILRSAILNDASGIILAHNHPSGDSSPTAHDIQVTEKIKKAAELFEITLLDHLIIGNDTYSFREEGLL